MIPWFAILEVLVVLGMVVTGHWTGTGTGFDDLDRIQERLAAQRVTSSTSTTTPAPYLDFEDPKEIKVTEWEPDKRYVTANVEVRRLPNDFGIIISKIKDICVTENNLVIGSRFEPNQMIQKYIDVTKGVENALSKFRYAKIDGPYIARPTIAGSEATTPPSEIGIAEDGEKFAFLKKLIAKMRNKYIRVRPILNAMSSSVKTVLPYVTSALLETNTPIAAMEVGKNIMVNLAKKFIRTSPSLEYSTHRYMQNIEAMDEHIENLRALPQGKLNSSVQQLIDIAFDNMDGIQTMENIVTSFLKNKVSPAFYQSNSNLRGALKQVHASFNQPDGTNTLVETLDQNLDDIMTKPLTTVVKKGEGEEAEFDVYTILPLAEKKNMFTIFELTTVPVPEKKAYRQYQPTLTKLLIGQAGVFKYDYLDFKCLEETMEDQCQTCYIEQQPKKVKDKCTLAILGNNVEKIKESCPYVTEEELQDTTVRLNANEWAYSISKPAELKSFCESTKETSIMKLPYEGIIHMPTNADCTFEFKNGPFSKFKPVIPGINMVVKQYNMRAKKELTTYEVIKDHVKLNSTFYIVLLLSTLLFTFITGIIIFCCSRICIKCKNCVQRVRNARNARRPRHIVQYQQSPIQIIETPPIRAPPRRNLHMHDLQPMWAVVPSRR